MPNKCSGCQNHFYTVAAFDHHRVGGYGKAIYNATGNTVIGQEKSERRCLTVDEMQTISMYQDSRGVWHNPARAETEQEESDTSPHEGEKGNL